MTISTLKCNWHQFWINHNLMLIESCIDERMIQKLIRRVEYHEMKLSAL